MLFRSPKNILATHFGLTQSYGLDFPLFCHLAQKTNLESKVTQSRNGETQLLLIHHPSHHLKTLFHTIWKDNGYDQETNNIKNSAEDPLILEKQIASLSEYEKNSYYVLSNMAEKFFKSNHLQKANTYIEKILTQYSILSYNSLYLRAKILLKQNKIEKAKKQLTHLTTLSDWFVPAQFDLSLIYFKEKNWPNYIALVKKYLKHIGNRPYYEQLFNLILALHLNQQQTEAKILCQNCLTISKEKPHVFPENFRTKIAQLGKHIL